jgi:Na+-transporting NADH:ubiquinone oxidoreductase subunit NqrB
MIRRVPGPGSWRSLSDWVMEVISPNAKESHVIGSAENPREFIRFTRAVRIGGFAFAMIPFQYTGITVGVHP